MGRGSAGGELDTPAGGGGGHDAGGCGAASHEAEAQQPRADAPAGSRVGTRPGAHGGPGARGPAGAILLFAWLLATVVMSLCVYSLAGSWHYQGLGVFFGKRTSTKLYPIRTTKKDTGLRSSRVSNEELLIPSMQYCGILRSEMVNRSLALQVNFGPQTAVCGWGALEVLQGLGPMLVPSNSAWSGKKAINGNVGIWKSGGLGRIRVFPDAGSAAEKVHLCCEARKMKNSLVATKIGKTRETSDNFGILTRLLGLLGASRRPLVLGAS